MELKVRVSPMITAILEDSADRILATCSNIGNEQYLLQRTPGFVLLSELSEIDNDVFESSDMPLLIEELKLIRETLEKAAQAHVDDLIGLAIRCRDGNGLTLAFTPFA